MDTQLLTGDRCGCGCDLCNGLPIQSGCQSTQAAHAALEIPDILFQLFQTFCRLGAKRAVRLRAQP
ncbi:hypothetical protein HPC62_17390 [Thermoleptolyngbya sichuanensis A183]|uniref:Uncharacterized protein n=1 Tax=Thermoleptolyngbya sichuanensis A183 TaxID=2737172 RepID=A0A6M8BC52_9CYAN|nr:MULTISPECIES: hypothetical protein [Thermoleptolyngbya]QKD83732.1 hypothetical protein HPC62_17390 [Thermoleptolyngbya sichuanensis A183]